MDKLAEIGIGQVAVFGIPGHVTLEKQHAMPFGLQALDHGGHIGLRTLISLQLGQDFAIRRARHQRRREPPGG